MTSIGIIGAGTAGLHLGLRLQMHGVPVTIYAEREPSEMRSGRLPNTVAHNSFTRKRERALEVNHWDSPDFGIFAFGFAVGGPQPFRWRGRVEEPSLFLDYRLYHPRLAEDFVARGGRLEIAAVDPARVERLAEKHDLVVVATGRAGLSRLFEPVPEHSPYSRPARQLFAGLFHGIRPPEPLGMQFNVAPGHGEIFEARMMSLHGHVGSLLIEAIPGGALERLCTSKVDEDRRGFEALLLKLLREHAPATFERVDPAAFQLTGPLDWLQGAVTPVVRRAYTRLGTGRSIMAVGDAHVLHDPVAGLGANAASASAWVLAENIHEALVSRHPLDEAFCQRAAASAWETVRGTTIWSNALLEPPTPQMAEVLFAASQYQGLADAVVKALAVPENALAIFASPESAAAFLAKHRGGSGARVGQ